MGSAEKNTDNESNSNIKGSGLGVRSTIVGSAFVGLLTGVCIWHHCSLVGQILIL